MNPGRTAIVWLAVTYAVATPAMGQSGIVLTIIDSAAQAPVVSAVVRSRRLGRAERSDRLGRVSFDRVPRPDTIDVSAVGFAPTTIAVEGNALRLTVSLGRLAVVLAALTVTAEDASSLAPTTGGGWTLPRQAMANLPPAVEVDPLRSLALVPAVSFSSPLSARPIVRGYDAAESVIRIDGFEVLNPYHIGRIFSGFPADATESVELRAVPALADGGTLAGVVDLRGRLKIEPGARRGADFSLVSGAGWWSLPESPAAFAAGRVAWLDVPARLAGSVAPYAFQDVYGHAAFSLGAAASSEWSVFASHDAFAKSGSPNFTQWSGFLLGQRLRLIDQPAGKLDVNASVNRFTLDGDDVRVRSSAIDLTNRFSRATVSADGVWRRGSLAVLAGAEIGTRAVVNTVVPRDGGDVPAARQDVDLVDANGFLGARWTGARIDVLLGLRVDAADGDTRWQPRGSVAWSLSRHLRLGLTGSRAARFYQVLTDPQQEPTIAFFDFWFVAGRDGVPVPTVNHLSAQLDGAWGRWSAHVAAFASAGEGLGEVRPIVDQRPSQPPFRFGSSRTAGLESRIGWRSETGDVGTALSYVLSNSERRWDDGVWRPWKLDRRHLLRLQAEGRVGPRLFVFGAGEFLSGQPVTPVANVVWPIQPPIPGTTPDLFRGPPAYLYAGEGSARSAGTWRLDAGLRVRVPGPGSSVIYVGASVLNLSWGAVAPEIPVSAEQLLQPNGTYPAGGVPYQRLYSMPAVPSVTARIEF